MGETLDPGRPLPDHLGTHDNMPQQLAVIGIIVLREGRNLQNLADIMAHGRRQQQISL